MPPARPVVNGCNSPSNMACDPRAVHSFRHDWDVLASQVKDVRHFLEQAEFWHLVEVHRTSAAQLHHLDPS